ncbi:phytoene desaturase family protein [Persicitalea jodogahamensis]|uniref:FAD-dependent oxidoreductase n=1 Tax=Persicitalea jodogahamensis TaxID=402147 RepID=A0A8J3D3Z7_9BACT|nr:NAD(P)/FAD-dependent oxidoreductase [Persicitalea jodogahamensis]GHB79462.1 FAD-dependent oxidoreductase [Persicitalea jodogahamensis]
MRRDYDAVVVGAGPNGLSAAIVMAEAGLSVLLIERARVVGGSTRSEELTLPGFIHDVGAAVVPLAISSPFFQSIPLHEHGLTYLYPPVALAHPFDNGTAAMLLGSVHETSQTLGPDGHTYGKLLSPIVDHWSELSHDLLSPFQWPRHPVDFVRFGLKGLLPATTLANQFKTQPAKALLAGMAAHSFQPLTTVTTSAIALTLMASGHSHGWPVAEGGTQSIANALASYFKSLGGHIETDRQVDDLNELPKAKVFLLDLTPQQVLRIAGNRLSETYRKRLANYRYGSGVFKVDWALREAIPFLDAGCRRAGTVHIGGSLEEIQKNEQLTADGQHPEKPFVLLAQPSLFDAGRAPAERHTAWAYCHVPHGSTIDMTDRIEQQVERFAPGFREIIMARHTMNTAQFEDWNPNCVGGDINGGNMDWKQFLTRPITSLNPYQTSDPTLYICSSSTPPGGGVHGMCGYNAARAALRGSFGR